MIQVCRSALYVPSINARAIEKSRTIASDAVIFDLEDSVAPEQKQPAREQLADAMAMPRDDTKAHLIRCNPIGSSDYLADLQTIRECRPDALVLPKVSSVQEVQTFEKDAIAAALPVGINTWYMIETAAGIADLNAIVAAGLHTRWPVTGLMVGHNDLALETGVSLNDDRRYLIPWLMQIVLCAKKNSLLVLDSVWNDFRNTDGFKREAQQGKQMGFDGKSLIHPNQVPLANNVFSPSEQEIAAAEKIVAAFADPANDGAGVISLDGQMVERLHLEQAHQVLARAR
jgi:citrate lyase subunit beta/citryl-CoA lyase